MMAYLQTSPKMEAFYEDYVAYLREEKHCSPNTLSAYQRDMQKFFDYAEESASRPSTGWRRPTCRRTSSTCCAGGCPPAR